MMPTPRRLLIIDPDPSIRRLIRSSLSPLKLDITEVGCAWQARESALEEPPDLALVDLELPELRSSGLLRVLDGEVDDHPVSCVGLTSSRRSLGAVGPCESVLRRPISPRRLLAEIRRITAIPEGAASLGAGRRLLLVGSRQPDSDRHTLETAGFKVKVVQDPRRAPKEAADWQPQVVIAELVMAWVDGFRLCRRLRDQESLEQPKVILLSRWDIDAEDYALARKVGADRLTRRTQDLDRLLSALEGVTAGTAAAPQPVTEGSDEALSRAIGRQHCELDQLRRDARVKDAQIASMRSVAERLRGGGSIEDAIELALQHTLDSGLVKFAVLLSKRQDGGYRALGQAGGGAPFDDELVPRLSAGLSRVRVEDIEVVDTKQPTSTFASVRSFGARSLVIASIHDGRAMLVLGARPGASMRCLRDFAESTRSWLLVVLALAKLIEERSEGTPSLGRERHIEALAGLLSR